MALSATKFSDSNAIIKTFERAASFCPTEESVYAMMTIPLQNIRVNARSFVNQVDTTDELSNMDSVSYKTKAEEQTSDISLLTEGHLDSNVANIDKSTENDEGFFSKIKSNFTPQNAPETPLTEFSLYSECIPCAVRINMYNELPEAALKDITAPYIDAWERVVREWQRQLESLNNLFEGMGGYADICAFIDFLNNFVCTPDLGAIISLLMALINRLGFDFGGVFGILLQFISPFIMPFLTNLIDTLQKYALLVLKPIECIIDAIQNIFRKLDYNVFFQNIENTYISVKGGRRQGEVVDQAEFGIPFTDIKTSVDVHGGDREIAKIRPLQIQEDDPGLYDYVTREKAKWQQDVEEAESELAALDAGQKKIDGGNPQAMQDYKQKRQAAEEKLQDAKNKRDLSAFGRINKSITEVVTTVKSFIMNLMNYLRKGAQIFDAFFRDVYDEFRKLIFEFTDSQGGLIGLLIEKMGVVQMIQFINAIVDLLTNGEIKCDNEDEEMFLGIPADTFQSQSLTVWTDDQGRLHIDEDEDDLNDALESVVNAFGTKPPESDREKATDRTTDIDAGTGPTDTRQRVKSLIDLTGDPVLDTQIARMTESLVTPRKITFKCPMQTSLADAEQVNKWIMELSK
jgi:hypothetical protein